MTKRSWCPTAWLDEVTPVRVSSPSEALHRFDDGRWGIVCDDFRDAKATAPSDDFQIMFVEPGQIVGWSYSEGRGDFVLTIAGNGAWSLDAPMPEQVTHWLETDDWEALGDSVPDLIRIGDLGPGKHNVMAYYWSGEIPHRFEIEGECGRLVQCAGTN